MALGPVLQLLQGLARRHIDGLVEFGVYNRLGRLVSAGRASGGVRCRQCVLNSRPVACSMACPAFPPSTISGSFSIFLRTGPMHMMRGRYSGEAKLLILVLGLDLVFLSGSWC